MDIMKRENMTKEKGAIICGFYGNYNLGDEAMLAGMINILRKEQDDLSFTVLSNDPDDTKKRYSVESIHRFGRKFSIQRFLRILQSQYFILGGGDLLRDSVESPVAINWLRILEKALLLRRRTMVMGVSVGEIWRPETQAFIPKILNQVDLLTVRDIKSKTKLEKLGVSKTIHVISDLALETLPENLSKHIRPSSQPIQVGISVRHLSNRGRSIDVNTYHNLLHEIASVADFLVEQYGATVHFLPFRTEKETNHATDDDYVSILNLIGYSRHSAKFVVHRYFESLENLTGLISTLDLMIGMRLHSLILSAGLGVPIVAAEYDSKVRGFMEEIGQSQHSIPLDCFDKTRLLPLIENILGNPSKARKEIELGVKSYRERIIRLQPFLAQIMGNQD